MINLRKPIITSKDLELFVYSFIHAYIEAEYEMYRAFPATTMMKVLEILMDKFRDIFSPLLNLSLEDYAETLEKLGYVKKFSIEWDEKKVKLTVLGCRYANKVHRYISDESLCLWAALGMMILKTRYEKVRFYKRISKIIENGAITELSFE